jgi:branched-chain amino acid transport system ATP-binding protein
MTLLENLLVAQHRHLHGGFLSGIFNLPAFRRAEGEALDQAGFWLERVGLAELANRPACALAYGQQRRLGLSPAAGSSSINSLGRVHMQRAISSRRC